MTELAEAIRAARGKRSRREFAEMIGVTQTGVYAWERMDTVPKIRPYILALIKEGVPKHLFTQQRDAS